MRTCTGRTHSRVRNDVVKRTCRAAISRFESAISSAKPSSRIGLWGRQLLHPAKDGQSAATILYKARLGIAVASVLAPLRRAIGEPATRTMHAHGLAACGQLDFAAGCNPPPAQPTTIVAGAGGTLPSLQLEGNWFCQLLGKVTPPRPGDPPSPSPRLNLPPSASSSDARPQADTAPSGA